MKEKEQTIPASELLSPDELAARLKCSVRALQYLRTKGVGPSYVRLSGRKIRYRTEAVEAWLESLSLNGAGVMISSGEGGDDATP